MITNILYSTKARSYLIQGIDITNQTISFTLGPSGRNVLLHKNSNLPIVIDHGYTILKELEVEDFTKNLGIKLMYQAASQTNDIVGDGTASTIIIAYHLISLGLKHTSIGVNIKNLILGMTKSANFLTDKINEYAKPVNSCNILNNIATLALDNNYLIGKIIAEVIETVGLEGSISFEQSTTSNTYTKIVHGVKLHQGIFSPLFIRKQEATRIIQNNPYILVTDKEINDVEKELLPLLELVAKTNRSLLIIAKDLSPTVLSTLIINRSQGILDVVAIRVPGFGVNSKSILEDLCIVTHSQIISDETGLRLSALNLSSLGEARQTVLDNKSALIILDSCNTNLHKRSNQLRKQINISSNMYDIENLKTRLARISGKAAVINIDANDDTEFQYKKFQFEKALKNIKAALEEGVLPGGGSIYAHLALELSSWAKQHLLNDELTGSLLVKNSLISPLKNIISNVGDNQALVIDKLLTYNFNIGYNANCKNFVDLYQEGILDSAKTVRLIIHNAISIAKMFLTTECIIMQSPD